MSVDIYENSAIVLLVDDVVFEDLVVERSRAAYCARHDGGYVCDGGWLLGGV